MATSISQNLGKKLIISYLKNKNLAKTQAIQGFNFCVFINIMLNLLRGSLVAKLCREELLG